MTTSTYRHAGTAPARSFMPFRTPVRGHSFAARPPSADPPHPGQQARLVREPDNPRDPLAVAVWVAGDVGAWRIGYLDRAVAARIAPKLDHGGLDLTAHIDGWQPEPHGRWQRPLVVLTPTAIEEPRSGARTAREPRGRWGEPPRSTVRVLGGAGRRHR